MDFRSTKGKIIIISLVGALVVIGGGLAFGLNLREVQAQKIAFSEGCDKLRVNIDEDFATYQKELVWPLSFLANYDSAYNPLYNPEDPISLVRANINRYRFLSIENNKYQGAQQSIENLDALAEKFNLVEKLREKKRSKEQLLYNGGMVGSYLIEANRARYSPFGSRSLSIFTVSQIELLESAAARLYYNHMSGAWKAEDQSELDNAISEFTASWRNVSDLCSKARA
jgi:hypothetical protein